MDWHGRMPYTTYSIDGSEGSSGGVEVTLMQRQASLLQQFVLRCCGDPLTSTVTELMAPSLNEHQRLLGATLAYPRGVRRRSLRVWI